ncbi:uncharacterized protein LOC142336952 [Convolutriloba macropyga]|uniref:uncharacterized protein LOC142336952 n=1 Tax=Convolutriloba macropyga TaxID=536237 RepID=UPI003F51CE0F
MQSALTGKYGENLAVIKHGSASEAVRKGCQQWYKEVKNYMYPGPRDYLGCGSDFGPTGYLTQLMWKETTHVGCGVSKCSKGYMYVCRYSPPGNDVTKKLFDMKNYKKLCKSEPGVWKSCSPKAPC